MWKAMFLHPCYLKYHILAVSGFLHLTYFLYLQNWIERAKLNYTYSNYTVTGLLGQVIVLHIYHLKFLHTYYKWSLKICMSLNYIHNTHCKFLKIQILSMQDTAVWEVQCSQYYSVWGVVRVFLVVFFI